MFVVHDDVPCTVNAADLLMTTSASMYVDVEVMVFVVHMFLPCLVTCITKEPDMKEFVNSKTKR